MLSLLLIISCCNWAYVPFGPDPWNKSNIQLRTGVFPGSYNFLTRPLPPVTRCL